MNQRYYALPLLLLAFTFFGVHSALTSQPSQTQNLRHHIAGRKLAEIRTAECNDIICFVEGHLDDSDDSDVVYHVNMTNDSRIIIELSYEEQEKMGIYFDLGPWEDVEIRITTYYSRTDRGPLQIQSSSNYEQTIWTMHNGWYENRMDLMIKHKYDHPISVIVTITPLDKKTPAWVIAVSVVGGVIGVVIIAGAWYFRHRKNKRRQRQNQNPNQNQNLPTTSNFTPAFLPGSLGRPDYQVYPQAQTYQQFQLIPAISSQRLVYNSFSLEFDFDIRFPEVQFESLKTHYPQKACTICLDDFSDGQFCRQLGCQHIFHSECVKVWVKNQNDKKIQAFCPNCNQQILNNK